MAILFTLRVFLFYFVFYFDVWPGALCLIHIHYTRKKSNRVKSLYPNDSQFTSTWRHGVKHIQLVITILQSGLLTQFFTPFMLCLLIFYISGVTYSLKSTSNYRFLRRFSWQLYLLSEFLLAERKSPRKYLLYIDVSDLATLPTRLQLHQQSQAKK